MNYQVTNGWGSGYVADITVTDTGPSPINGWTLTFAFPTAGETLSSPAGTGTGPRDGRTSWSPT